ncbi:MAG: hypothetical protein Q4B26_03220 [Eubacteriales bacterium]|nr:hypothetical protein [Eubacteriales bacterium]
MPKTTKTTKTTKNARTARRKVKAKVSVGRWGGHKFIVSNKLINSFSRIEITGSLETEDKEKNKQIYVARKRGKPRKIELTIPLSMFTGCKVKSEAKKYIKQAEEGKADYFYLGGKKLFPCKLILTEAHVKNIKISHSRKWTSCEVTLTLRETGTGGKALSKSKSSSDSDGSSKSGGSSGGSGGGGGGGGSYGGGGGYSYSNRETVRDSDTTTDELDAISSAQPRNTTRTASNYKDRTSTTSTTSTSTTTRTQTTSAVDSISRITGAARKDSSSSITTQYRYTVS